MTKINLRKRILTFNHDGKRIVVDSKYCRVGNVYTKPIINLKTKQDENK